MVQAQNDPIAPETAIPFDALLANPNCTLVVTPSGGHLGWCCGSEGVLGPPWTDRAVIEYLQAVLKLSKKSSSSSSSCGGGKEEVTEVAGVFTVGSTTHQAP